jgi:hypothetical protein
MKCTHLWRARHVHHAQVELVLCEFEILLLFLVYPLDQQHQQPFKF